MESGSGTFSIFHTDDRVSARVVAAGVEVASTGVAPVVAVAAASSIDEVTAVAVHTDLLDVAGLPAIPAVERVGVAVDTDVVAFAKAQVLTVVDRIGVDTVAFGAKIGIASTLDAVACAVTAEVSVGIGVNTVQTIPRVAVAQSGTAAALASGAVLIVATRIVAAAAVLDVGGDVETVGAPSVIAVGQRPVAGARSPYTGREVAIAAAGVAATAVVEIVVEVDAVGPSGPVITIE